MVREIRVILEEQMTDGKMFGVRITVPAEFFDAFPVTFLFKTVSESSYQVTIGGTLAETCVNLYQKMFIYASNFDFIEAVQYPDGASFKVTGPEVTSSTNTASSGITITHEDVAEPIPDPYIKMLSRSPYFVNIQPSFQFDKAEMELRVYRGDINSDYPDLPNYLLSKTVVQAGQEEIVFDIQSVVNDFVKSEVIDFSGPGAKTTSVFDSVWVEAIITAFYQGDPVATATRKYWACDGFGYHMEGYNPTIQQFVLTTNTQHIFYFGSAYPIFFTTEGLNAITVNGDDVPFSFNDDFNNQVVGFVNVSEYAAQPGETFSMILNYDGQDPIIHSIQVKSECKYEVWNCWFKNRFGFWQSIPFTKARKTSLDTDSQSYTSNIASFGKYDTRAHGKRTFMMEQTQKEILNTDFLPEYFNNLFRELLLSEFVYLEHKSAFIPVLIPRKTFNVKTRTVDKLIQYTMEFEYAFNLMNTVKG